MSTNAQANKIIKSDYFERYCERKAKRYMEFLNKIKPHLIKGRHLPSAFGEARIDDEGNILYTRRTTEREFNLEINISKGLDEDAMEVQVDVFERPTKKEKKKQEEEKHMGTISFNYYKAGGIIGKVTDLDITDFRRSTLIKNRLRRLKESLSISTIKPDFSVFRLKEDFLAEDENDPEWLKELKNAYKKHQSLEYAISQEQDSKQVCEREFGDDIDTFIAIDDPQAKERIRAAHSGIRRYERSCQHIQNCRNAEESILLNEVHLIHNGDTACSGNYIKNGDEIQCVDCGYIIGKEDIGEELFDLGKYVENFVVYEEN